MNSDEELRKLFIPAKRKAVALFKNDHDDGDTAIYQFITDIIPLLQDRDAKRDAEKVRQGVNYVLGSLVLDSGDKFTPRQSDLASKALERFLAALKEVKK